MDNNYIQRLKERLPLMKEKLKTIELMFGTNSDQWNIANDNLLEHQRLIKTGIPKNINQSTEVPYDLAEGF